MVNFKKVSIMTADRESLLQLDADAGNEESFYVSQLSAESTQPKEVQELEGFWRHHALAAGSTTGLSTGQVRPVGYLCCVLHYSDED